MQRIRDGVAEIVDDLSAHEDKADRSSQLRTDAEEQSPLAQLDTPKPRRVTGSAGTMANRETGFVHSRPRSARRGGGADRRSASRAPGNRSSRRASRRVIDVAYLHLGHEGCRAGLPLLCRERYLCANPLRRQADPPQGARSVDPRRTFWAYNADRQGGNVCQRGDRHSLRATLDGTLAAASDPPQAEEPSEGSKIALVPAAAARLATAPNPVPDHDLGEASKVEPSPPRSVNKSKRHPKSPQLNR